MTILFMLCFCW